MRSEDNLSFCAFEHIYISRQRIESVGVYQHLDFIIFDNIPYYLSILSIVVSHTHAYRQDVYAAKRLIDLFFVKYKSSVNIRHTYHSAFDNAAKDMLCLTARSYHRVEPSAAPQRAQSHIGKAHRSEIISATAHYRAFAKTPLMRIELSRRKELCHVFALHDLYAVGMQAYSHVDNAQLARHILAVVEIKSRLGVLYAHRLVSLYAYFKSAAVAVKPAGYVDGYLTSPACVYLIYYLGILLFRLPLEACPEYAIDNYIDVIVAQQYVVYITVSLRCQSIQIISSVLTYAAAKIDLGRQAAICHNFRKSQAVAAVVTLAAYYSYPALPSPAVIHSLRHSAHKLARGHSAVDSRLVAICHLRRSKS